MQATDGLLGAASDRSSLLAGIEHYAHELALGSATRRPRAVACAYAPIDASHDVVGAVGHLFRGSPPLPPLGLTAYSRSGRSQRIQRKAD